MSFWIKTIPFLCLFLFASIFGGQMLRYRQAQSQVEIGIGSYRQGNYPQAEGAMRHALALNPNNAYASYYLGLCLLHDGNRLEAKHRLETADSIARGGRYLRRNDFLAEETKAALNGLSNH